MLFVFHPKFCISIVFSFSWGHFNSQEKLKTMLMQNFGVTNCYKEHYGMLWYFWSGQLWSCTHFGHSTEEQLNVIDILSNNNLLFVPFE